MRFRFDFDQPEIISIDKFDSVKLTFFKTNFFLMPEEEGLSAVPSGYTITSQVPP